MLVRASTLPGYRAFALAPYSLQANEVHKLALQIMEGTLSGERPTGSGEHFPRESLEKCRARWMDEQITKALNEKQPGWVREEASRVGVYKLEIPYEEGEDYLVAADPGWSNPPYRNSPVIGVWKYSDFPYVPAQLVAFAWVFGNNSPKPWMHQFTEYVINYHAIGQCGFDSTGFQSGYERMTDLSELMPTPVILTGSKKYTYLNLTKKIFAEGKFQIPSITHLFSQCARYQLPDDRLRQIHRLDAAGHVGALGAAVLHQY